MDLFTRDYKKAGAIARIRVVQDPNTSDYLVALYLDLKETPVVERFTKLGKAMGAADKVEKRILRQGFEVVEK